MHPARLGADPVGGLIRVQHRQGAQQRHEGGDERLQAAGRLAVDRVDGTGGDAHAEQVGHGLRHPPPGQMLAAEQVGDGGPQPRAVADRRPRLGREQRPGDVPARTARGVRPVLGDHGCHLGQLDDLAGGELAGCGVVELGPTALAAVGPVVDDLIGSRRHLQPFALGPPLLAPPALRAAPLGLRPSLPLFGLALALGSRIP